MPIKLDKNIPLPIHGARGEKSKVVRGEMKTGDSVFVTDRREMNTWRTAILNSGYRAISRKEGKGWRIWKGEPEKS